MKIIKGIQFVFNVLGAIVVYIGMFCIRFGMALMTQEAKDRLVYNFVQSIMRQ